MHIESPQSSDIPVLQGIVGKTGLFPPEMLPEMIAPFLDGSSGDIWLSCAVNGAVAGAANGILQGFCYAVPEQMTDGVWNMLALAVLPDAQRNGAGAALVAALEAKLRAQEARLLLVDTSSSDAFDAARSFYLKAGYRQEARIADYWAPGDDKITFVKAL